MIAYTQKEQDLLDKTLEMRREAEEGNDQKRQRMRRCRRFKIGEQWDKEVKDYYKSKRKHCSTINRILPIVLQVLGVHSENRKDIRTRNIRGGTATASRIISALLKHALTACRFHQEHENAFDDGLTTGEGCLLVEMDYTEDVLNGDLVVKKINPLDVWWDTSNSTYNRNKSARYVIWDEWVDENKCQLEWPAKKEYFKEISYSNIDQKSAFGKVLAWMFPRQTDDEDYKDEDGESIVSSKKHKVRISHTWWKEWRKVVYVYKAGQSELEPLKITKAKEISFAKKLGKEMPNEVSVIEKIEPLLHHTKAAGDLFLEDIKNPFPYKDNPDEGIMLFPVIPINPYFTEGYVFGLVQNLIGPQEEHNYLRSTLLNISKQLANTGWIGRKINPQYKKLLEDSSDMDGIVLEEWPCGGKLEKIKPNEFSTAHAMLAERSAQDMLEISHVRMEQPDFDNKNMSGRAIALKQQSSLTGTSPLFSNDEHSMLILGNFLVELIRNCGVYSDEEIRAVVDEEDMIDGRLLEEASNLLAQQGVVMPEAPINLQQAMAEMQSQPEQLSAFVVNLQEEMEVYEQAKAQHSSLAKEIAQKIILNEIKSLKVGKYGLIVDQQQASPTMRSLKYMELLELHKLLIESGVPGIPREHLIEAADPPNKEAILAARPQMAGAA